MRKIVISFCILLAALSLKAQTVSGIRIDGGDTPILVYFGGNQMCLPTTTCFVANLKSGYYTVEVYATRSARPGERVWKGRRLYNERIYFDGNSVKEIYVDGRGEIRPGSPGRPGQEGYCPDSQYDRVMSEQLFKKFLSEVKKEPFKDDRMEIMKMMYPRIVDKGAFFTVIATLTFSSNKDEMNKFVQSYGRRR